MCPPGYSCYNETLGNIPTACRPGFYSYGGLSECLPCPVGESYRDYFLLLYLLSCGSLYITGTYSEMTASVCSVCPPGHSCLNSSEAPVQCSNGFWSPGAVSLHA